MKKIIILLFLLIIFCKPTKGMNRERQLYLHYKSLEDSLRDKKIFYEENCPLGVINCGHTFHIACIRNSNRKDPSCPYYSTCPICNHPIYVINFINVFLFERLKKQFSQ
jgi:hypothetical protein